MIEATKAYKTSDGMTFPTLEGAQIHALSAIIDGPGVDNSGKLAAELIDKKSDVIAILKLKPRKQKEKAAKPAKAAKSKKGSKVPADANPTA